MSALAVAPTRPADAIGSIEVYADVACPFTYVGLRRLIHARDTRAPGMAIRVRAWPLEWINGKPLEPEHVAAEIAALRSSVAPGLFAGFDPTTFPTTTIGALALAGAAYARGDVVGELVSLRLRTALFEEGRDIGDPDVVRAVGAEFGVAPSSGLATNAAVRAEWERGRTRGVRGSPHFFAGTRDWFCPSLRIKREGEAFDVAVDAAALEAFYGAVFA